MEKEEYADVWAERTCGYRDDSRHHFRGGIRWRWRGVALCGLETPSRVHARPPQFLPGWVVLGWRGTLELRARREWHGDCGAPSGGGIGRKGAAIALIPHRVGYRSQVCDASLESPSSCKPFKCWYRSTG